MRLRLTTIDVPPAALAELGERLRLDKPATRARLRAYLDLSVRAELDELAAAAERRVQPELPLSDEAAV